MTDVTKYKSVAIKIDVYNKAKPMAQKKYMSMGSFLKSSTITSSEKLCFPIIFYRYFLSKFISLINSNNFSSSKTKDSLISFRSVELKS